MAEAAHASSRTVTKERLSASASKSGGAELEKQRGVRGLGLNEEHCEGTRAGTHMAHVGAVRNDVLRRSVWTEAAMTQSAWAPGMRAGERNWPGGPGHFSQGRLLFTWA
jgi:hypothetical protein